nr:hypothetical protein [Woeseiaceae bacterium]
MIDPKLLRQSAEEVAANLARRGFEFDASAYLGLEEQRKALQVETETLRSERNASAKNIGKAKAQGEDVEPLLAAVQDLGERLETAEGKLADVFRACVALTAQCLGLDLQRLALLFESEIGARI